MVNDGTLAYISFGANLGDRLATWQETLALLEKIPQTHVVRAAQPVETDPVGPIQDQPRYLNSVIALKTTLTAPALLHELLKLEQQLGRVRRERWGPRTVDLDILLFGDQTINTPELTVPHPELKNRAFFCDAINSLARRQAGEGKGHNDVPSSQPSPDTTVGRRGN